MTLDPEVSIITPCYNAANTLGRTIDSVLSQKFKSWELLLVDDKSLDGTYKKALAYANTDNRIQLIKLDRNSGAAIARNTGIAYAKGRFIAFIDADDQWHSDKLQIQINRMKKQNWPLSYTAFTRINDSGSPINTVGVPHRVSYKSLLKTNYIGCSTAIYDTEKIGKVFMPELRKRQDFGLWLRILRTTDFGYGINTPLTLYRVGEDSLSSNKRKTTGYNWRLYRQTEGLSLMLSAYYFAQYAIRGVLRSKLPRIATAFGLLHKPEKL